MPTSKTMDKTRPQPAEVRPDGYSAAHAADRLGMAIVSDEASGRSAFGPESLSGRALVTAHAPESDPLTGPKRRLSSRASRPGASAPPYRAQPRLIKRQSEDALLSGRHDGIKRADDAI